MADEIKALEWEGWIRVTAEANGWLVARTASAHNSPVPKLFLVRDGEMLAVQARTTKASGTALSAKQQRWLDTAATVPGVESVDWAPTDMAEATTRLTRGVSDA